MRRLVIGALLIAAPVRAFAGEPGIETAIETIYAPYLADSDDLEASLPAWERPIFSPATQALVSQWRAVSPTTEVDALSGADWFCQCQDWDASAFRAEVTESRVDGIRGHANVRLTLAPGEERVVSFDLVESSGTWLVDDLVAADFPEGLRQALRDAIGSRTR